MSLKDSREARACTHNPRHLSGQMQAGHQFLLVFSLSQSVKFHGRTMSMQQLLRQAEAKDDSTSFESLVSTLTAKRAHFRTTLNHGAYAAVGLHETTQD